MMICTQIMFEGGDKYIVAATVIPGSSGLWILNVLQFTFKPVSYFLEEYDAASGDDNATGVFSWWWLCGLRMMLM